MDDREKLYNDLLRFIKRKFSNLDSIDILCEDIVNEAYLNFLRTGQPENENFGYMSRVCIHTAYKLYHYQKKRNLMDLPEDFMAELASADTNNDFIRLENAELIAASLKALKEIEQAIITLRYYDEFSFTEIAASTGIKLNTVLSHHRRALEKLRPRLTMYFDEPKGFYYGKE